MRLMVIIAFLALLITPCMAEPDNVTTGPYNISFDLGVPKDSYDVSVSNPRQSEALNGDITTSYTLFIDSGNNVCLIGLSESNSTLQTASPESLGTAARDELIGMQASNIEIATRIIDGSNGAIASGNRGSTGNKIYNALYNVKTGPNPRHLVCSIISDYPWEKGTLQILKTIHVEKKAAALARANALHLGR